MTLRMSKILMFRRHTYFISKTYDCAHVKDPSVLQAYILRDRNIHDVVHVKDPDVLQTYIYIYISQVRHDSAHVKDPSVSKT